MTTPLLTLHPDSNEPVATRPYTDIFRYMNIRPTQGGTIVVTPRQAGKTFYIAQLLRENPGYVYVAPTTMMAKYFQRGYRLDNTVISSRQFAGGDILRGRTVTGLVFDEVNPNDITRELMWRGNPDNLPYLLMVTPPSRYEDRGAWLGEMGVFSTYIKLPEAHVTTMTTTQFHLPDELFEVTP